MSYGIGCRHGLDLVLLWLWCRQAARAPFQPLAWEPPYAADAALKKTKKKKRNIYESSHCGAVETNLTRNHEVPGSIPDIPQWVKDPALPWLWYRPAATALIRPLAWEPTYAVGAVLEKAKRQKNKIK